jgi:cytidine deaminase
MQKITDINLIDIARSVVSPHKMRHGFTSADVGSALITSRGNVFVGVCIDTCSGLGFCAEHSAIASMVTNGEYKIKKIVAVTKDGKVLPPCGRCREFISHIHEDNINAEIIVKEDKILKLKELLPYSWDEKK